MKSKRSRKDHPGSIASRSRSRVGTVAALRTIVAIAVLTALAGCAGVTSRSSSTTAPSGAILSASPATLSFGSVSTGSSTNLSVTISNLGSGSTTVFSAAVTGSGFTAIGAAAFPISIAAGQNAAFQVQFAPQAAGTATGAMSLVSDASNSPLVVALSGSGIQSALNATPSTVNFGNVAVGSRDTQSISLTNATSAAVTITQASSSGTGVSTSGWSLPVTINAGGSASFSVAFAPASTGSVSGSVSLVSNAPNSPLSIPVGASGTASTSMLTVSPSSVSFANAVIGQVSTQEVTLTNGGNTNVTISNVSASGTDFAVNGVAAGTMLTPNQSASLDVTFTPTASAIVSGSVTITSNAASDPAAKVALAGTGVTQSAGPSLTPPICGLSSNTSNIIPNATTWANFTPPAVGSTYTDAAYGCAVTRLTDANTDPGGVGEVHYYSLSNPLSAADTKVLIFDQNGNWHAVDTNGNVIVSTSNFGPGQGMAVWDVTNDDVFWRASGNTLEECTINSSAHTAGCVTNHTFAEYGYMVNIPDKGDMSPGGWINMAGQSSQGGSFDIFMYNPAKGTKSPTYSQGSCDGDIADSEPGCLHSTTVFVGEDMTADFEGGSASAAGIFWAAPFNASSFNTVDQGDHNDEGVWTDGVSLVGVFEDYQPNPGPWGNCQDGWRPTVVPLSSTGAAGTPRCLFDNRSDNPGWHVSFRDSVNRSWVAYSTQASSPAEYFNSDGGYQAPSSGNWNVYTNEILLIRVDANNNPALIYRLALTHSRMQESGAYWTSPRVALSRSGNYAVFDSNAAWGQNGCGSINICTDVYLIKLH
jgi:hypothetical protein